MILCRLQRLSQPHVSDVRRLARAQVARERPLLLLTRNCVFFLREPAATRQLEKVRRVVRLLHLPDTGFRCDRHLTSRPFSLLPTLPCRNTHRFVLLFTTVSHCPSRDRCDRPLRELMREDRSRWFKASGRGRGRVCVCVEGSSTDLFLRSLYHSGNFFERKFRLGYSASKYV